MSKLINLSGLKTLLEPLVHMINKKAERPDWNENDPSSINYIAGRTHYEGVEERIISSNFTIANGEPVVDPFVINLVAGESYAIEWDGVMYNCVAYIVSGLNALCIGNGELVGILGGNGEPFFIGIINDSVEVFGEDGDHTFRTSISVKTIHKIDEKYLPETQGSNIGKKGSHIGAEIFNDYKNNEANGMYSHADGHYTIASGYASHAEGNNTSASGDSAHAEGELTTASGDFAHAEGQSTIASGDFAHAEGQSTIASGKYSHAEGWDTEANYEYSHAEGNCTITSIPAQHVQGKYNIEDSNAAHIVGNGSSSARSNSHTLDWQGNAWYAGDVYVGSTSGTNKDEGSKKLATEEYVTLNSVKTNLTSSDSVVDNIMSDGKEYIQLYADDSELYVTVYGKTNDDLSGIGRSFQLITENLTIGMKWSRGTIDDVTGEDVILTYHYKTDTINVKPNTVYTLIKYGTEGDVALYGYDNNGSFIGASKTGLVCSVITGGSEQFPLRSNMTTCVIRTKENIHGIRLVQYTYSNQHSMSWNMYEGTEGTKNEYQFEYAPTNDDLYGNGSISDTYENCVFVNGKYVSRTIRYWKKINSYNGELIPGEYVSSTGSLDTGATIIYLLDDPEIYYGDVLRLKTSKDGGRYDFIMTNGTMYIRYSHRADHYLTNGATGDSVGLNVTMRNSDDTIIYPKTTYNQIILQDGSCWDGGIGMQEYVSTLVGDTAVSTQIANATADMLTIDTTDSDAGTVPRTNSDLLGGKAASEYALKTDTAPDSSKLGGKTASEYALKTDTAPDSSKLGGKTYSEYALKTDLGEFLPIVTSSDSGKFLMVNSSGTWVASTIPNASGVNF